MSLTGDGGHRPECDCCCCGAGRFRGTDPSSFAGEPDLAAPTFAGPRVLVGGERAAEVDGGLLEYLRGDLAPPGEPGRLLGDGALGVDDEDAPGGLAALQALKALIGSNPDHGTHTDGVTRWAFIASVTSRRHWL